MTLWYKYPYTSMHDMNLDWIIEEIKDLKAKVDEMDMETLMARLDDVDSAISTLETDDAQIKADLLAAQALINGLRSDLDNDEARIDAIEDTLANIDVILEPLADKVDELTGEVGAMQSQVTSNTGRIEALEGATLNAPTESNFNLLAIAQLQDLDNLDYEIVVVTDNGAATNNIEVYDGLIRFRPEASHNECALVIKNVLPVLVGTYTSSMILSFGNKYKTSGSNNGTDYCVNVPFTSLTGSSPYIASTGYTTTRASLRVLQLKVGVDGKSYDLWIYNKYQGQYPILPGANVSILALAMVFRGFDNSFSTASIKAYFSTIYGNTAPQVAALIEKKKTAIISSAVQQAETYANVQIAQAIIDSNRYTDTNDYNSLLADVIINDGTGGALSFNPIDPSTINPDIVVNDYSRYGTRKYTGTSIPPALEYPEQFDIFFNIEVTITGSGAVNTPTSIPVLNITNTKGATIPHIIPLTVHAALPNKHPFSEAYLHTNGNVIFRTWFDDTGWDYSTNPVTVRISGYVPLYYFVNT